MSAETVELLRQRLTAALTPQTLRIEDESQRHTGHAGAKEGGHYKLVIVAEAFAGKNTVARHRLIYDIANELMHGKIHALAIHARAPGEV